MQWDAKREVWDVIAVLDDSWCEDCMRMSKNAADTGDPCFGTPPDKNTEGRNGA